MPFRTLPLLLGDPHVASKPCPDVLTGETNSPPSTGRRDENLPPTGYFNGHPTHLDQMLRSGEPPGERIFTFSPPFRRARMNASVRCCGILFLECFLAGAGGQGRNRRPSMFELSQSMGKPKGNWWICRRSLVLGRSMDSQLCRVAKPQDHVDRGRKVCHAYVYI